MERHSNRHEYGDSISSGDGSRNTVDIRLIRRLTRDLDERGRTVEVVPRQCQETVRPMHLEFGEPTKRWADIIMPGGGEDRMALEMVVARGEQLLGQP